jgi:heme-degrading monooxygenase HmoA
MSIAFINTFIINGDDKEFKRLMAVHERFLRTQPGFGSFELLQSKNKPIEYTNIIEWDDEASHRRLIEEPEFQGQVARILVHSTVACTGVNARVDFPVAETEVS